MAAALRDAEVDTPLRDLGIPQRYLDHGSRSEVLAGVGLTAPDVARRVTGWAAGRIGAAGIAGTTGSRPSEDATDPVPPGESR